MPQYVLHSGLLAARTAAMTDRTPTFTHALCITGGYAISPPVGEGAVEPAPDGCGESSPSASARRPAGPQHAAGEPGVGDTKCSKRWHPMLCGCHVRRAYRSVNLRKMVGGYLTFRCRASDFRDSAASGAK